MGPRIPEKEIANFQFNVFCNVADIWKVMEQHHILDQFPNSMNQYDYVFYCFPECGDGGFA